MKAIIDRDECISCEFCVGECPEVFTMADDGKAEVIAEPTKANIDSANRAAEGCPVSIITIEE